ncbi:MAG: sugar ABC transporter ATP-binding protein [Fimbriimonas sp.]
MPEAPPVLQVRHVTQQFPAVRALDEVSVTFHAGRVHGVIGENGAGKSTLMRVLAGLQIPTSGEVLVDGAPTRLGSVREAEARGIVMIHQELNLVDELTVAENVFLGREPRRGLTVDRATMERRTAELLAQVGAPFAPTARVADLSLAAKQLVEIAKAISHDARVIVMDEPTAVLSRHEVEALFALVAKLRERGVAVIYISHILSELIRICDEITVMRDGKVVGALPATEATPAGLARMMVGREMGDFFPPKPPLPTGDPILEARHVAVEYCVRDVSLEIRAGEIVGLAGLIGSGRTETAEAIAGLRPRIGGEIRRDGSPTKIRRPKDAVAAGIAYVSEDRKGAGLVLDMDVVENATLASLSRYGRLAVDTKRQRAATDEWVRRLDVRVGDVRAPVRFLSGGNQQKVAVAKWLETQPKVLILDEPTRGVDVGAKREIYDLIGELAKEGMACLVISSEMTELIGLCHRILVLQNGRVSGELTEREMTEENIMMLAAGIAPEPMPTEVA